MEIIPRQYSNYTICKHSSKQTSFNSIGGASIETGQTTPHLKPKKTLSHTTPHPPKNARVSLSSLYRKQRLFQFFTWWKWYLGIFEQKLLVIVEELDSSISIIIEPKLGSTGNHYEQSPEDYLVRDLNIGIHPITLTWNLVMMLWIVVRWGNVNFVGNRHCIQGKSTTTLSTPLLTDAKLSI